MDICMQVARDIVVKMIEHGSFDNIPATSSETNLLQNDEHMATQICKAYREIFETVRELESSSTSLMQKLYQGENQI